MENNINQELTYFLRIFLNWNYNSDILNIISSYIHLQPINKIRYYGDEHHWKRGVIGKRGIRSIPYTCSYCDQLCYNQNHEMVCTMMASCDHCTYSGLLNSEYLLHKQNMCPSSTMECEYCNVKGFRQNMYNHYDNCNNVLKCNKCNEYYTKDNINLHQLFC